MTRINKVSLEHADKMKKNNSGRKLFDGKEEKLVLSKLNQAFVLGASDAEACFYADISESALYRYCESNNKFRERKEALKLSPVLKARKSVVKGLENDYNHALKFLERVRKEEFSLRTEQTGKDGRAMEVDIKTNPIKDLLNE